MRAPKRLGLGIRRAGSGVVDRGMQLTMAHCNLFNQATHLSTSPHKLCGSCHSRAPPNANPAEDRRTTSAVRIRAHISSRCTRAARTAVHARDARARRLGSVHSSVVTFSYVDVCICAHRSHQVAVVLAVPQEVVSKRHRCAAASHAPPIGEPNSSYLGTRRETTSSLLPAGAAGVSAGHQDAQARRAICLQGAIANFARICDHHHDRTHGTTCRRLLLGGASRHDGENQLRVWPSNEQVGR